MPKFIRPSINTVTIHVESNPPQEPTVYRGEEIENVHFNQHREFFKEDGIEYEQDITTYKIVKFRKKTGRVRGMWPKDAPTTQCTVYPEPCAGCQ